MEELVTVSITYLGRIIGALVIWTVGRRLVRFLIALMEKRMTKVRIDDSLISFLSPLVKITLKVLLVLTVTATLGVEITTFTAVIGAASFAVGLAFQGSLANFAGGVLILALKPFKVGDFIASQGFSGTVREIQVFYTVLQTIENQKVIIPNAELSNASAINYSAFENRRTNFKLPVPFDTDIQLVKDTITKCAADNPLILKEPEPAIVLGEYSENGLVFYIRVWAKSTDYWTMYFGFLEQIKKALDKKGISISYRKLDVYVKETN
ncbi:MAG: mechanosensitive ion channel [Firmicutes bacterium]|nr:mechanosensitive ion channel [Bacillota bacterium]